MGELSKYVKEQLKAGYTVEQVKQGLLNYYPPSSVDAAVREATSKIQVIPVVVVIVLIGAIGGILLFGGGEKLPLSVSAAAPSTVKESQQFIVRISVSDGNKAKHAVNLLIQLFDSDSGLVSTQKDFIAISGKGEKSRPVKTDVKPGEYVLKVTASTKDEKAEKEVAFTVLPAKGAVVEPETPVFKNEPEKQMITPNESPKKGIGSLLHSVSDSAGVSSSVCDQDPDGCLSNQAAINNDKDLCSKISTPEGKDSCLSFFFLHSDYSVCGQISNAQLKKSCESLRDFDANAANPPQVELPEEFRKESSAKEVSIKDSAFAPDAVEIPAGSAVTWINNDNILHSIKSEKFSSQTLEEGDPYSFEFADAGIYDYECGIHSEMKGRIVVK